MSDNIGGGALAGLAGHYGSDSDDETEGTAAAPSSHKSSESPCKYSCYLELSVYTKSYSLFMHYLKIIYFKNHNQRN